ncbi:hypothetical protein AMELA_G00092790 [Ameiurus melas]|uniref:CARD domain-containing protein n=1 Tax=Ameiurus melas TaxID=219545 RepID=A0A7J6B0D9_AMEME|nr:hypothetical protein AMELA_G00092790 [Ameiurus melas]
MLCQILEVTDTHKQHPEQPIIQGRMDTITSNKGQSVCVDFLQLLKEDDVNESSPELKEWITSVNTSSEIKAAPQRSIQSSGSSWLIRRKTVLLLRKTESEGTMDIIQDKKVQLIEWLSEEDLILQHVHSRKLITMPEYKKLKSIQDPIAKVTELLDIVLKKGDPHCIEFLELLKKDDVNESRPALQDWIRTVDTSALKDKKKDGNTSQAGTGEIADNQEFLRKNRGKLIDNVKTVDRIVDDLNLTDEMVANVRAERTEQAKMRKVLEYTNSTKAAKLLVDALWKHAGDVMEELTTA